MSKRFPPTTLLSKYFKVINHKYYKDSNESCIYADWAVRAGQKISAIFLKYPNFEVIFKKISWSNQIKNYMFFLYALKS